MNQATNIVSVIVPCRNERAHIASFCADLARQTLPDGWSLQVLIADGRSDAYAESHINSWDVAAGLVIAREAGAWTSDFFPVDGPATGNPVPVPAPGVADAGPRLAGP